MILVFLVEDIASREQELLPVARLASMPRRSIAFTSLFGSGRSSCSREAQTP